MKNNATYFGVIAILALAGCAGHGVATSSSGQNSGQSSGPSAAAKAPQEVENTVDAGINSVSTNGQMIGSVEEVPTYWSSPTAASRSLPLGGFVGVIVTAVNSTGQIVGFANQGFQNASYIPIYWSSPTATPVALQLPSGASQARPFALNASGQIVGDNGGASGAVYWPSPTSTPVALAGPSGNYSDATQAVRVSDSGVIFGVHGQTPLIWTSPQASPQQLPLPTGTTYSGAAGSDIAMNQATGEAGGGTQAGGNSLGAVLWTPPSYGLISPATPSGFTGSTSISDIGPKNVLIGEATNGNKSQAVVWTSPSAQFKMLSTVVPTAPGWTLLTAEFMTADGTIIGTGMDPHNNYAWFVAHM